MSPAVALTTRDESAEPIGALAILDAHGVYLSEPDEVVLEQRLAVTDDVADLSLRTCRCGFHAYPGHLREVIGRAG